MSSVVYEVKLARSAKKEVKLLDGGIRVRAIHAFRSLTNDPRPPGCRKLVGATNRWRIRVGDYRILYEILRSEETIIVHLIGHRREVYKAKRH